MTNGAKGSSSALGREFLSAVFLYTLILLNSSFHSVLRTRLLEESCRAAQRDWLQPRLQNSATNARVTREIDVRRLLSCKRAESTGLYTIVHSCSCGPSTLTSALKLGDRHDQFRNVVLPRADSQCVLTSLGSPTMPTLFTKMRQSPSRLSGSTQQ